MSAGGSRYLLNLSKDHKPCDPDEQQRITEAGGKVYQ
jgi:hypothetical protein